MPHDAKTNTATKHTTILPSTSGFDRAQGHLGKGGLSTQNLSVEVGVHATKRVRNPTFLGHE